MRYLIVTLSILMCVSCQWGAKDTKLQTSVDSLQRLNRPLLEGEKCRVYEGVVPAASCTGMRYRISMYSVEGVSDGVYEMCLTYLEAEDGADVLIESRGRWSAVVGTPSDSLATVYRLVDSVKAKDTINLLYGGAYLSILTRELEPINSELNYKLQLIAPTK